MNKKIVTALILLLTIRFLLAESWHYLGQTPPDSVPLRFGTSAFLANQSWQWHGSPVFSPDFTEVYFTKYKFAQEGTEIWFSKYSNNQWSTPAKVAFSNYTYRDNNPCFAGNDTLYFCSQRSSSQFLYYVVRQSSGSWSAPTAVNLPMPNGFMRGNQFSRAANGNIYSELINTQNNNEDLYLWRKNGSGQYGEPEVIANINSDELDFCPAVDPLERFLLFSSHRTGGFNNYDLYISYKSYNGSWSLPQNLGSVINQKDAFFPNLSPDGQYLFFSSQKAGDYASNAYWVKAVNYINPVSIGTDNHRQPNNIELLQNYPNPFNPTTTIKFSLPQQSFASICIYNVKGELVRELGKKIYAAGLNSLEFNSSSLDSGQYFYQLTAGDAVTTKKMMVIK